MAKNNKIGLSAHTLNLFNECERCFYLHVKEKIQRPRGPMPSVATGLDLLIKEYFEYFRKQKKLPPFLQGKIDGELITNLKKTHYYDIEENEKYYLWGHLDEIIKQPDGLYIPIDHKTRATLPSGEPHNAYKFQLGIYSLLLKKENKKEVEYGYLIYYYPEKSLIDFNADEIKNIINFNFSVVKVEFDVKEIKKIVLKAIECLESGKIPPGNKNCEYCRYLENVRKYYSFEISIEDRTKDLQIEIATNEKKEITEEVQKTEEENLIDVKTYVQEQIKEKKVKKSQLEKNEKNQIEPLF